MWRRLDVGVSGEERSRSLSQTTDLRGKVPIEAAVPDDEQEEAQAHGVAHRQG